MEVFRFLSQILYKPVEVLVFTSSDALHLIWEWCWALVLYAVFVEIVRYSFMQLLDDRQSVNIWRFLESINEYVLSSFHLAITEEWIMKSRHLLCFNRRPDLTEALKKLQCRTLIFVGENSPFHSDAVYMATKMNRKFSALVEVLHLYKLFSLTMSVSYTSLVRMKDDLCCNWFVFAGSGMWISCDWRATSCNAPTVGVLPCGLRFVQAKPAKLQPQESAQSIMHIPRTAFAWEHGCEAEAHQNSHHTWSLN